MTTFPGHDHVMYFCAEAYWSHVTIRNVRSPDLQLQPTYCTKRLLYQGLVSPSRPRYYWTTKPVLKGGTPDNPRPFKTARPFPVSIMTCITSGANRARAVNR
jgi:hypothetical protein